MAFTLCGCNASKGGFLKGIVRMYLHARKASMYLRNLDFNLGNGAVQRRLLDLLRLPFSSKTWVKGSSIFSKESSVNRGILFKRLG
jgi:hypothetical protein